MEKKVISDAERNNKTAMICHTIEAIIITVMYFADFFMGVRELSYVLMIAVLALAPVIAEQFFWCKNHETGAIKHIAGVGFAITYSVMVLTANNYLIFVYVIPMILVTSVFNDTIFSLKINIGSVVLSLIMVIGGAMTGGFGYYNLESGVLQIITTVLTAVYSITCAHASNENNRQKVREAVEAHEETEALLKRIADVSKVMYSGMTEISEQVNGLNESSKTTREAMKDVTTGTNDTADAVQSQLSQTEEIQHKVDKVSGAADNITDNMQHTLEVLENGKKDVELLVRQVETSVQEGADIAEKLETLDNYIVQMHSIVEVIGSITSQTSLLALNASIEAARAGEAGRGFSVVATEISGMATQTKEATVNITKLIGDVSSAISEVVSVIRNMIAGINEEKKSTENTAASFENIQSNTFAIRDNVSQLTSDVLELREANQVIADSVQTISAITEQVSAHANETMDAEQENSRVLNAIAEEMSSLIELSRADAEQ